MKWLRDAEKEFVLAKTIEMLCKKNPGKILILVDRQEVKSQIKDLLFQQDLVEIDQYGIEIETEQKILRRQNRNVIEYSFVIFYDAVISDSVYDALFCKEKTVLVFTTTAKNNSHKLFTPNEVVFSYSYTDAVNDGYLTPAMDTRALQPAVEAFSKHLLEQFGYRPIDLYPNMQDQKWDFIVRKGEQKIWVECKAYKSQVVSPSTANSLLKVILCQKAEQAIPQNDIILLVVLSRIPSLQKDEIYKTYRIVVLDIDNLVFNSKNDPPLLKQLSQITYFPIDYIEGLPSREAETGRVVFWICQKRNPC